jgi:hypothetical protein
MDEPASVIAARQLAAEARDRPVLPRLRRLRRIAPIAPRPPDNGEQP